MEIAAHITAIQDDVAIRALYERLRDHPKLRWKDSIKKVVGLGRPTTKGLDL